MEPFSLRKANDDRRPSIGASQTRHKDCRAARPLISMAKVESGAKRSSRRACPTGTVSIAASAESAAGSSSARAGHLRAQRASPKSQRDDTRVAPDQRSAVRGNDVMSILLFPRFAATARGLSRRAVERGSCWWWWGGYPRRQSLRSFALG